MITRLITAAALAIPAASGAQAVFGLGSDASVAAVGTVRVSIAAQVSSFDRRYSRTGDGTLEPFGTELSADSLGLSHLPQLGFTQTRIRALANDPAFTLTLGRLETSVLGRVERLPLTLEVGVVRRVSVFATVPLVRTRAAVGVEPTIGAGATVGVNPALVGGGVAFRTDTALVNAFGRAAQDLRTRLAACAASSSSDCASINSNRAAAEAFAASAEGFRDALRDVYLSSIAVPTVTSAAHNTIATRIGSFRAQFQNYNVASLNSAPTAPVAATPLGAGELDLLLSDAAYGINALPLATTERTGIGDVELGARMLVLDRLSSGGARGFRVAVGGLLRLDTGERDAANSFVDIGLGDGQTDIEGSIVTDVAISRRFTASVAARYVRQLQDDGTTRVPLTAGVFQPADAEWGRDVTRDLGDVFELEVTPRYNLGAFFALGAQYVIRRKGADRFEGAPPGAVPDAATGAALFDPAAGTEFNEHRLGFGISFSNVPSSGRRRRIPYEVSYLHYDTIRASGGLVPKTRSDAVQVRVYYSLFGR